MCIPGTNNNKILLVVYLTCNDKSPAKYNYTSAIHGIDDQNLTVCMVSMFLVRQNVCPNISKHVGAAILTPAMLHDEVLAESYRIDKKRIFPYLICKIHARHTMLLHMRPIPVGQQFNYDVKKYHRKPRVQAATINIRHGSSWCIAAMISKAVTWRRLLHELRSAVSHQQISLYL